VLQSDNATELHLWYATVIWLSRHLLPASMLILNDQIASCRFGGHAAVAAQAPPAGTRRLVSKTSDASSVLSGGGG
jgi:hypothetical protein